MIRIYGVEPGLSSELNAAGEFIGTSPIINIIKLHFDYNRTEYLYLTQSPLHHDIFVNRLSEDLSGQIVTLPPDRWIDGMEKVIFIPNKSLPNILNTFDAVQKAKGLTSGSVSLCSFLVDFLRISFENGLDVLSTSELDWSSGD